LRRLGEATKANEFNRGIRQPDPITFRQWLATRSAA
jgi:hypothetical protein